MRVAVLGSGSWGTALAIVLARNGHDVALLGRDPEEVQAIQSHRENLRYLPGFAIPARGEAAYARAFSVKVSVAVPMRVEPEYVLVVIVPVPDVALGIWLRRDSAGSHVSEAPTPVPMVPVAEPNL